jgi:hypothetical protein
MLGRTVLFIIFTTWKGCTLIAFDVRVDLSDKDERAVKANSAENDEEKIANHSHVSEKEGALQKSAHSRAIKVVKDRVTVDKQSSGSRIKRINSIKAGLTLR